MAQFVQDLSLGLLVKELFKKSDVYSTYYMLHTLCVIPLCMPNVFTYSRKSPQFFPPSSQLLFFFPPPPLQLLSLRQLLSSTEARAVQRGGAHFKLISYGYVSPGQRPLEVIRKKRKTKMEKKMDTFEYICEPGTDKAKGARRNRISNANQHLFFPFSVLSVFSV